MLSLACSPGFVQLAFCYNCELPAQGSHHPQWAAPTPSIISQEKAPIDLPTGHSDGGGILQLRLPLLRWPLLVSELTNVLTSKQGLLYSRQLRLALNS